MVPRFCPLNMYPTCRYEETFSKISAFKVLTITYRFRFGCVGSGSGSAGASDAGGGGHDKNNGTKHHPTLPTTNVSAARGNDPINELSQTFHSEPFCGDKYLISANYGLTSTPMWELQGFWYIVPLQGYPSALG